MENAASRFGQRLAHTEKKYRDQALKKLTAYLTKKHEWNAQDWDKLWKALFYCMWMSDKRPIQEELSSNLAGLVHKIPTAELALDFVHRFFFTMHREWHGIDGLRLDKFYSLIRKFVHQSVVLLQNNDWETALVEKFVSMLSQEIVSQVPNGLRMHLSDLYIEEVYLAAGSTIDTASFLLLLEPFFTLLSSEYDRTIHKRVRELVLMPMLTTYKFGKQPTKEKMDSEEDDETDAEDEKVFEHVELAYVQHRIFTIASADDTAERNRSALYDLYGKFFEVTKVDSLKATQDGSAAKPPVRKQTKAKKVVAKEPELEAVPESTPAATDKKKKNKKRKQAEIEAPAVVEETKKAAPVEPEAAKSPVKDKKKATKKQGLVVEEEKPVEESKKRKKQKTQPVAEVTKEKEVVAKPVESKKKEKTAAKASEEVEAPSKKKKKKAAVETPKTEDAPAEAPKSKKEIIVRSGMKFQRCVSCRGYGKGFLPASKDICGHCERNKKKVTKKTAAGKKRSAAEASAAAAAASAAEAESAKKVTFGKNKALRHEVSVKRLKASAKQDDISKEDPSAIKGVLKVKTPPASATKSKTKSSGKALAGKRRKTAADFF